MILMNLLILLVSNAEVYNKLICRENLIRNDELNVSIKELNLSLPKDFYVKIKITQYFHMLH